MILAILPCAEGLLNFCSSAGQNTRTFRHEIALQQTWIVSRSSFQRCCEFLSITSITAKICAASPQLFTRHRQQFCRISRTSYPRTECYLGSPLPIGDNEQREAAHDQSGWLSWPVICQGTAAHDIKETQTEECGTNRAAAHVVVWRSPFLIGPRR